MIYCINFIIGLAILDTSYLNMHFFGTHTCLCRLQNCPSADFGVFKYAWAVTQKVWNEAENGVWGSRVFLLRHALPTTLLILRKKQIALQSNILDIYDTAWSDQIRSDWSRLYGREQENFKIKGANKKRESYAIEKAAGGANPGDMLFMPPICL